MASLVADYGDSSEDSNADGEGSPSVDGASSEKEPKPGVNFFGDGGSGVDLDESDQEDDALKGKHNSKDTEYDQPAQPVYKLPAPAFENTLKLPAPHLDSKEGKNRLPSAFFPGGTSSVFVNPFEQAEQAKLGILEKHVRLTEAAPSKPASKQVCFKFKKGKCHLGDKCRFFHDRSNIALGNPSGAVSGEMDTNTAEGFGFGHGDSSFRFPGFGASGGGGGGGGGGGVSVMDGQFYHPAARFSTGQPADPDVHDDDNYMKAARGKKRHGVTDALVPPKKALNDLDSQRTKERPWTVSKKKK